MGECELRDVVVAVAAVIAEVGGGIALGGRKEVDGFGGLADGDDGDGGEGQLQGLADRLFPEIKDEDAAQAHLDGLQQDRLGGNAQVDVHDPVLRNGAAYHDESTGLQAGLGQMLLGKGRAQGDVRENLVRVPGGDQAVTQGLAVHAGSDEGGRRDQFAQFPLRHFAGGVVTAVAAVAVQERIQGRCALPDDFRTGLGDLLLTVFEVIIGHDASQFPCKGKVFRVKKGTFVHQEPIDNGK